MAPYTIKLMYLMKIVPLFLSLPLRSTLAAGKRVILAGVLSRAIGIGRLTLSSMLLIGFVSDAHADLIVLVDLSEQTMRVKLDGEMVQKWSISSGAVGYVTPVGSFRPTRMHETWYSRKYDGASMPSSIFFHGGYAIHGTLETSTLGRPDSRGCVRLDPEDAKLLFDLVKKEGMSRTAIIIQE